MIGRRNMYIKWGKENNIDKNKLKRLRNTIRRKENVQGKRQRK